MKWLASCVLSTALAVVPVAPVKAQKQAPAKAQPSGDQVIDGLRFHPLPGGGFIQVFDGDKSAGTIILPPNQPPMLSPLPEYADRLKQAFEKYSAGSSQPAKSDAASPTAGNPGSPAAAAGTFDAATNTVTMTDGVKVTFQGKNVQVSNFHGQNYKVAHRKASAGASLKTILGSTGRGRTPAGTSGAITGEGVVISDAAGRKIYDSSDGVSIRGQLTLPQGIAKEVMDAIDVVRQTPGHSDFTSPVSKALKATLEL